MKRYTSSITGNGTSTSNCYIVDEDRKLAKQKNYDAGGIGAGFDAAAYSINVLNNVGIGIHVIHDLQISGGKICDNTEGDLFVEGKKTIADVEVCGEE